MAGLGVTVLLIPLTMLLGKALAKSRREQVRVGRAQPGPSPSNVEPPTCTFLDALLACATLAMVWGGL
jgi:hypothetical protein